MLKGKKLQKIPDKRSVQVVKFLPYHFLKGLLTKWSGKTSPVDNMLN